MNEPNIKRFWENLNNAKLIRYLLLFTLGWAIIQVLAYFDTVLIVFIFAAVLAFLLSKCKESINQSLWSFFIHFFLLLYVQYLI